MNLNKVFLVGRLTQDPQTRTTPSGQIVCTFGLATNRVWTNQKTSQREEKAEFHNIVLWRRLAEIASQYLTKGSLVLIEGRIQTRSWQDSAGNKRYRTEIVAENIQLAPKSLSPINQSQSQNQNQNQPQPATVQEDIPIIEEGNHPPVEAETSPETSKPSPVEGLTENLLENKDQDDQEIDVKDIPF